MRVSTWLVLAVVVAAGNSVLADTVIVRENSGFGLSEPRRSETWFAENQVREDMGRQSLIADLDVAKVYVLRHDDKTYLEFDYPIDFEKIVAPELVPMLKAAQEQARLKASVSKLDETRKIDGRSTNGYRVDITSSFGEGHHQRLNLWVTDDPGFDVAAFKRLRLAVASTQPLSREMVDEVMKIPGFPLVTESKTSFQGQEVETVERLVSVEQREAPEGLYAPPADYQLTPLDLRKLMPPPG